MAQKIQTLFIDDIDGGEADGTVRFALDGAEYEIDLSSKHDEELRSALRGYIDHARKVSGPARKAGLPAALAASPAPSIPSLSAPGRGRTATTSRTADGSRPTSSPSTRQPSDNKAIAPERGLGRYAFYP